MVVHKNTVLSNKIISFISDDMEFQTKWNSFWGSFDPALNSVKEVISCSVEDIGFNYSASFHRLCGFWSRAAERGATACNIGLASAFWSRFCPVLYLPPLLVPLPVAPFSSLLLSCVLCPSLGSKRSEQYSSSQYMHLLIYKWQTDKDIKCLWAGSPAVCTQQTVMVINCVNAGERKCVLLEVLKSVWSQMNVCLHTEQIVLFVINWTRKLNDAEC